MTHAQLITNLIGDLTIDEIDGTTKFIGIVSVPLGSYRYLTELYLLQTELYLLQTELYLLQTELYPLQTELYLLQTEL